MGKKAPVSPASGGGSQRDDTEGQLLRELEALSQVLYNAGLPNGRTPLKDTPASHLVASLPGSKRSQEPNFSHLRSRSHPPQSPHFSDRKENQKEDSIVLKGYSSKKDRDSRIEDQPPPPNLSSRKVKGPASPYLGGLDGIQTKSKTAVIMSLNGIISNGRSNSFRKAWSRRSEDGKPPIATRSYEVPKSSQMDARRSVDGAPPSYHEARRAENQLLKNTNVGEQFGLGSPDLQTRRSESNFYKSSAAERDHGGGTQLFRGKELQPPRLGLPPATMTSSGSLNSTEQTLVAAAAALRSPGKQTSTRSQLRVSQSEDLGKRIEVHRLEDRNERVEDDESGRRLVPWHSQDFEKAMSEVSNFAQGQGNMQSSKHLEASKEKRRLWNWKPFRAIAHIGLQRFNCMFTVRLHRIQSLPNAINGLRLSVTWKRKDTQTRSMPARVFQGVAQFDETLKIKTHVFGIKDGSKGWKFEPRNFELAVIALDVDDNTLGKHKMDLTRLLPKSSERRDEESDRTWATSFKLAGKASGGILNLTFGCQLLNKNSEPTSNLSSARFESPVIKTMESHSSLPSSPEGTTQEDWSSYVADHSPAASELSSDSELMKMEHLNLNDELNPNEDNHSTGKTSQRGQSRPSFTNDEDFPGAQKKLSFNQPATRGGGDLNKTSDDEDDDPEFNVVYQGHEISAIVDSGPPLLKDDDGAVERDTVQGLSKGDADVGVDGGPVDVIEAQVGEAVINNAEVLLNDEAFQGEISKT